MSSSKPNYVLKALPSNTIPLGVRVSTYEWGRGNTDVQSVIFSNWPNVHIGRRGQGSSGTAFYTIPPRNNESNPKLHPRETEDLGHQWTWEISGWRFVP